MPTSHLPLLDSINDPSDLRLLKQDQLPALAAELRQYIIESVSSTGGHLASGLGSIELTIALHYLYNTPEDRLVWDVGHQCYPHKILTGRKKDMPGLRQKDGIFGLPETIRISIRSLRCGSLQHLYRGRTRHGDRCKSAEYSA